MTLTYEYRRSHVWLDQLSPERDPHAYDLCRRHADDLSVPLGWHLTDRRSDRDRQRPTCSPADAHRSPRWVRGAELPEPPPLVDRLCRSTIGNASAPAEGRLLRARAKRPAFSLESLASRVVSSPLRFGALRDAGRRIDVPVAFLTWLAAWLLGQVVALIVYSAGGYNDVDEVPIWVLFLSRRLVWAAFLAGMALVSRRDGHRRLRRRLPPAVPPVDLLGVPIGVFTQLVLVPLVYLPLEAIWDGRFNEDELSENAEDLADRAHGLLDGAAGPDGVRRRAARRGVGLPRPVAGLVRRPRSTTSSPCSPSAALFALIHFRPVEYPGLFVIGLVLGTCALLTGRLGMAIACHIGFNVTGLILAFN